MNQTAVDKIVRAVLYEGYMLYPYRPSLKNQHRWTFGTLYPKDYSEAHGGTDPWTLQAQCLVAGPAHARLQVRVRFLQLVGRTVVQVLEPTHEFTPEQVPAFRPVDSLTIGEKTVRSWQETIERDIPLTEATIGELAADIRQEEFTIETGRTIEPLRDADGLVVGLVLRDVQPLAVVGDIEARSLGTDLFRVTIRLKNRVELEHAVRGSRDHALARSLLSTHLILVIEQGEFVSLIDPPTLWRQATDECRNIGVFPVLVGAEGEKDAMVCSPIVLYDYPQIAPESTNDFFDACEIDELLALRVATLTDQEKQEMSAVDERARAILEHTQSLSTGQMALLHGATRQLREVEQVPSDPDLDMQRPDVVRVNGIDLRPGDRVRLRPRRVADAFDILLSDRVATIATIERDFENRIHLAVTLEDDPGADLGAAGKIGHRFFFFTDEVEPLVDQPLGGT